jgi:D-beta-D-heptose 7-phosphate kinase/D-beta-D-heptose 1-phosphate adenosyltransferase
MDLSRLQALLQAGAGARVACVGDLMVDRYVRGEVGRISPEAPIPVLLQQSETVMLGGVGNVARNLAALGARAALAGVVGDDGAGAEAAGLVAAEAAVEGRLILDAGRRTTVKTRYVAGQQQLLRLDSEDDRPLSSEVEVTLAADVAAASRGAGAVLISDYAKGAVTPAVLAAARAAGAPVIVDPKGRSFAKYGAVALIKPNARELRETVDLLTGSDAEVERALGAALEACEAGAILVTRAARGASLLVRGQPVRHFRSAPRQVFDVSGAGDTVLAALGLALAAGVDLGEAVEFALLAAGVAVGKPGTAVVTPAELVSAEMAAHLAPAEAKIVTQEAAAAQAERWRAEGLKVGFTNGCFDILHRGHVSYLAAARAACDRLIVGVNSDASVRALKGEGRPVNDLESRALVLGGLACVDLVVPFDAPTPIALIEAVKPSLLMKGADYAGKEVVGSEAVLAGGGEVRLIPLVEGYSTTLAVSRMKAGA